MEKHAKKGLSTLWKPDKNDDIFLKKVKKAMYNEAEERHVEKGQDFYIIGKPIPIKKNTNSSQKLFDESFQSQLRSDISPSEIINSFPLGESILLFRTLGGAFHYARSMVVGNFYTDQVCLQPAVFKVCYNHELETLKVEIKSFKVVDEYKDNKSYFIEELKYCVTSADNVTPLIGYLKLEFFSGGAYKEYPEVHMRQLEHDKSKKSIMSK